MKRWHFRQSGEAHAPCVVLLHSVATRGEVFAAQEGLWSQHFRVVVPDLPGHGATPPDAAIESLESYAEGLAQLLDSLNIDKAAVLGVSLGGMIAQAFGLNYPERTLALVLAQTLARTGGEVAKAWDDRIRAVSEGGMASQVESTLARWFTPAFQKSAPLTLDWVRQMIAGTSVEGFIQAARAIQKLNFLERLAALPMPVLVVAGDQDGAASPDVARTLCAHLPQPQLTLIKGAAHQASIEQPVAFSEAVGAFLHNVLISRG